MSEAALTEPKVETREFRDASGTVIKLEVPEPGAGESVFVMAVHKAGSTLLNRVINPLARRSGRPLLALDLQLRQQGYPIAKAPPEVFGVWQQPGYIFGAIRTWHETFDTEDFRRDARKILLVRDPRDIATSLYFSQAKSHVAPPEGELKEQFDKVRSEALSLSIDDYIQKGKANTVLDSMTSFTRLLGSQRLNLFRYEDIIFRKREWILELARILQMKVPDQMLENILKQVDIVPTTEDPSKHIRRVKPGGFETKLSAESVRYIQDNYRTLFEAYRYPLVP